MLRVQEDLGYLAKDISEVNVADTENIRIVAQVEQRAIELIMGDSNFARAVSEFSQSLSGDPQAVSRSEDVRPAVGRPHYGKGLGARMAVKPLYAVGLDAGSRRTRMVICALEGKRLRFLGSGSVAVAGLA